MTPTSTDDLLPRKVSSLTAGERPSTQTSLDYAFFVFAGLAVCWLAWSLLRVTVRWGPWQVLLIVLFWLVLAYLVLPRIHRILTAIYVPDYFIGRARTSDGLLGDPINLALLGSQRSLEESMRTAGWTRAAPITLASSWRIITATLRRRTYDEAPVSPLLLFGRIQDFAYQQEVAGNPAKRHHVRFWRCPPGWLLPGGYRADWLAAATFDRRVGLSLFTLQVTHKIDANTDIERDHVVTSIADSVPEAHVEVIRDFSSGYHARNGGGDAITTDGDLPFVHLPMAAATAAPVPGGEHAAPRPAPLIVGCVLLLARVLAGLHHLRTSGDDTAASGFGGVVAALLVLLTILVFRGSSQARIAVLSVVSLDIVVNVAAHGLNLGLHSDLTGVALDTLILLALSSDAAREWSRGRSPAGGRS